jgi:hypothetical protein
MRSLEYTRGPGVTAIVAAALAAAVSLATGALTTLPPRSADRAAALDLPLPSYDESPSPTVRATTHLDGVVVTLLPEPCVLTIELDGRVVYRGRPRCKNAPRSIVVPVPPAGAARLRTTAAAFYANGGLWTVHDDELWVPLLPRKYVVGEGYAMFEGVSAPAMQGTHCVSVTSASPRYLAWRAHRDGPHSMGEVRAIGGEHDGRHLGIVGDDPGSAPFTRYLRLVPGTYAFHVDRRGVITMRHDPVDRCADRVTARRAAPARTRRSPRPRRRTASRLRTPASRPPPCGSGCESRSGAAACR